MTRKKGQKMKNRFGLSSSILDVIGNTLLVELSRLTKNIDGRILAKLEYLMVFQRKTA